MIFISISPDYKSSFTIKEHLFITLAIINIIDITSTKLVSFYFYYLINI